jgi:hypothetical protein
MGQWENGDEIPSIKHRTTFIYYLTEKLGLKGDVQTFEKVWGVLGEEWNWPPFSDYERERYFLYLPVSRRPWEDYALSATEEVHYKRFILEVIETLSANEFIRPPGVECLKTYQGKTGENYEIDLSYKFRILGVDYLTLVQCRSTWNRYVGKDSINILKTAVEDIGAHKGAVVTTIGYDSSAINVASKNGIALLKFSDKEKIDIVSHFMGPTKSILEFLKSHTRYDGDEIKKVEGIVTIHKDIIDFIAERYGVEVAAFLAYNGSLSIHQVKPEYKKKIIRQFKVMGKKREKAGVSLFEWLLDYDAIESCGLPVSIEPALEIRLINVKVAAALWEISKMENPNETPDY